MSKEFNYEAWVKECYEEKLDEEIHNASEANALLLFKTLFDKAIRDRENIKIISRQLLARFYNQLTDRLQQVIENGNTVSVIVEHDVDNREGNKFYQQLNKTYVKTTSNFEELPNFIVVGNNAFRYETDKNSTKAVANFNNNSMGSFISDLFDKINKNA
jgi:sugar-specific transcriptional regulator TrmB